MLGKDDLLGPLEGMRGAVVRCNERVDALANLLGRGEAAAGQRLPRQDAEPDLHLVEPGGVSGREVKMDVLVSGEPAIVFGLMGV